MNRQGGLCLGVSVPFSPLSKFVVQRQVRCTPARQDIVRCSETANPQSSNLKKPAEFKRGLVVPQELLRTGTSCLVSFSFESFCYLSKPSSTLLKVATSVEHASTHPYAVIIVHLVVQIPGSSSMVSQHRVTGTTFYPTAIACFLGQLACLLVVQEGHKEHTLYTLRFRTGFGRGCGLTTPGAGVQVKALNLTKPGLSWHCVLHVHALSAEHGI